MPAKGYGSLLLVDIVSALGSPYYTLYGRTACPEFHGKFRTVAINREELCHFLPL
jgi:hypothetical protein